MEIWIRSQDKKILVKATRLAASPKGEVFNNTDVLGRYEEPGRCLEVLNEIQNHIATLGHNQIYSGSPDEQYNYEDYIFQMPEN